MASASGKASDSTKSASGSVMVLSTGGTAVLTGDYSKLFGETPTTTAVTSLSPTSSNSLPTPTDSVSSPLSSSNPLNNISTSSTISQASPSATGTPDDGLTNTQLGAIIGGAAGGVLVLLCLVGCVVYHRKKKQKSFKRGRGITPSMVLDHTGFQQHLHPQTQMATVDRSFDQQSTYSFNSPQNAFGSSSSPTQHYLDPDQSHFTPTAPSKNITATVDKLYSIKQYNSPEHAPTERTHNNRTVSQASANGARLSKYNYLTQAFSQMRASYATQEPQQQDGIVYDSSYQGLAKPPFIQYPDPIATSEAALPATSSPYSPNNTDHSTPVSQTPTLTDMRDSSTTVLHAPIFKHKTASPSPTPSSSSMDAPSITLYDENNESKILHQGRVLNNTIISSTPAISTAAVSNKKLYFPGTGSSNHHRDSTLSDVSQYSTFSSSSNPFRYSDDGNNNRSTSSPTPPGDFVTDSSSATSPSKSPLAVSSNNYQSSPLSEKPYAYI